MHRHITLIVICQFQRTIFYSYYHYWVFIIIVEFLLIYISIIIILQTGGKRIPSSAFKRVTESMALQRLPSTSRNKVIYNLLIRCNDWMWFLWKFWDIYIFASLYVMTNELNLKLLVDTRLALPHFHVRVMCQKPCQ